MAANYLVSRAITLLSTKLYYRHSLTHIWNTLMNRQQLKQDWFNELEATLKLQDDAPSEKLLHSIQAIQTEFSDGDPEADFNGRELIDTIIRSAPQYGHLIPRDLLWLLGGDCLHFLDDAEIHKYQAIEDDLYANPNRSFAEVKEEVFKG
jgi:hypothetical protein